MLEFIVYLIFGTAVLLVVLACISVFISYVTQASYIDPLHYDSADHCGSCSDYGCLSCKCDDKKCCK